ncbi:MAG: hypothetical protein ACXWF8_03785 [Methylobacter sp.]
MQILGNVSYLKASSGVTRMGVAHRTFLNAVVRGMDEGGHLVELRQVDGSVLYIVGCLAGLRFAYGWNRYG